MLLVPIGNESILLGLIRDHLFGLPKEHLHGG